jgi:hypothetical protein
VEGGGQERRGGRSGRERLGMGFKKKRWMLDTRVIKRNRSRRCRREEQERNNIGVIHFLN